MTTEAVSAKDLAAAVEEPAHGPIRALPRIGKNDEAIVRLCAIVVTRPDDLNAKELLFDAFIQKRDWLPALLVAFGER
jgi:hypothetical protein